MTNRPLSKKETAPFIIIQPGDLFNSYGKCNFSLTRPATNLNNIKIESSFKKQKDKYPKNYTLKLFYNDKVMKKVKTLGEGGYGKVVLYQLVDGNNIRNVVVKMPFDDPCEEPKILKEYMKKASVCNHYVIPIRSVEDQHGNPFIIMQEANGSLEELDMDNRLKIKIIIQLTKIIKCFYNNGFVYTDLKKANILYRCKDEKIEFYLGDIGSFSELGKNDKDEDISPASFPPPEYAGEKTMKVDKNLSIYTLGATIADLYNLSDDLYASDKDGHMYTSNEMEKENVPDFHKKVKNSNIPNEVKEIILAFTTISPKKRLSYDFQLVFDKLC